MHFMKRVLAIFDATARLARRIKRTNQPTMLCCFLDFQSSFELFMTVIPEWQGTTTTLTFVFLVLLS